MLHIAICDILRGMLIELNSCMTPKYMIATSETPVKHYFIGTQNRQYIYFFKRAKVLKLLLILAARVVVLEGRFRICVWYT